MAPGRGSTYEGRPLPRPQEEVVDQGLGFDVGTLLSRRRVLALLGLGAGSAGLAACGADTTGSSASGSASAGGSASSGEIPDETAGPHPGDGSNGPDVLEQRGIVRSDIRSSFGTGSSRTSSQVTTRSRAGIAAHRQVSSVVCTTTRHESFTA